MRFLILRLGIMILMQCLSMFGIPMAVFFMTTILIIFLRGPVMMLLFSMILK